MNKTAELTRLGRRLTENISPEERQKILKEITQLREQTQSTVEKATGKKAQMTGDESLLRRA